MSKYYVKSYHQEFCGKARRDVTPIPEFFCDNCNKCSDKWCSFYNRYVVTDYNKCFNHSFYSPVKAKFQVIENLEQIIKEEEEKQKIA